MGSEDSSGGNDSPSGVTNPPSGVKIRGGRLKNGYASSIDRTTDRQLEAKVTTAGKEFGVMNEEERRQLAITQLEDRIKNPQLPAVGAFGGSSAVVSTKNLENQLKALRAGGMANFSRSTNSGQYVAVGVTTDKGTLGQEGEISGMTARKAPTSPSADNSKPEATKTQNKETPSVYTQPSATSAATRRLLAQGQKGQSARKFLG